MHASETQALGISKASQNIKGCFSDTETHTLDIDSPWPAEDEQQVIARLQDDEQLSVSASEA